MATYKVNEYQPYQDPKCDGCSDFDPDGFASEGRSWVPVYGDTCSECGGEC